MYTLFSLFLPPPLSNGFLYKETDTKPMSMQWMMIMIMTSNKNNNNSNKSNLLKQCTAHIYSSPNNCIAFAFRSSLPGHLTYPLLFARLYTTCGLWLQVNHILQTLSKPKCVQWDTIWFSTMFLLYVVVVVLVFWWTHRFLKLPFITWSSFW